MAEAPDLDALSEGIAKRLRETRWEHVDSPRVKAREELRYRVALIREDLAKVRAVDPGRADKLWEENVPDAKTRQTTPPEPDPAKAVGNSIAPGKRRKRRKDPEVSPREASGRPSADRQVAREPGPADPGPAAPNPSTEDEPVRKALVPDLQAQRRQMLLENLDKRFLIADGDYHHRDGDQALAFQATDRRLTTRRDDAVVITAMLDLAEVRDWKDIRLTGSKDFKKEAWFQAQLRGIETSGHRPDALDRARLEDAKKDFDSRLPRAGENVMAKADTQVQAAPVDWEAFGPAAATFDARRVVARSEPKVDLSTAQQQAVSLLQKLMRERGDGPEAVARATEVASEQLRSSRIHVGKLISTGTAPYLDKKDEKDSPFVVLEDEAGKTSKVWGVDLPRALQESRAHIGEEVVLAFKGREQVEVDVAIRDASGTATHTEKQTVDRNAWEVRRFDDLREEARTRARQAARAIDEPAKVRVYDKGAPSAAPPPQVKVERPRAQERFR